MRKKKVKKVLFITPNFYPKVGGVVVHSYNISKRLVEKGFDVNIITSKYFGYEKNFEVIDGIKVFRINKSNVFLRNFFMLKYYKLFLKNDIIHFHDPTTFFSSFILRFLFFWKKYFVTFHGYEGNNPSLFLKIYRKFVEFFTLRNICIGDFIKKWYNTNCTIVSYGGVDEKFFLDKNKKLDKEIVFTFLGRIDKDTDIFKYLNLILMLKKDKNFNFDIKLNIVGDGKYKNEILDFCKKNDIDFSFFGFVKDKSKIIDILKQSIFLFSSGYLSMLEGLASKNIVISFYSTNIKKDYLNLSIFSKVIVYSDKEEEIKKKIVSIVKNEKLHKEIIEKGYSIAENNTWNKVVEKYLRLYE